MRYVQVADPSVGTPFHPRTPRRQPTQLARSPGPWETGTKPSGPRELDWMTGGRVSSLINQNPSPRRRGARGWLGVPTSRGALGSLQPCVHFPQYKGTWTWSGLLSATIRTTEIDHSREEFGKRRLCPWETGGQAAVTTSSVRGLSRPSSVSFRKGWQDERAGREARLRAQGRSRPSAGRAQWGSGLEVAVTHASQ